MTRDKNSAWRLALAPLALTLAVAGCGSEDKIQRTGGRQPTKTDKQSSDGTKHEGDIDQLVTPPREYYDTLFANSLKLLDKGAALNLAGASQILWVNFKGASLTKGFQDGQSFILCKASATIPAAGLSPADEALVVSGVQQFYDDAGATLTVTAQQPASGEYTTIHVSGSYSDLGCIGNGVLGIAPFDVGNANHSDVGFAFVKNAGGASVIAETVAHEAGHSFGLEHVSNDKDLMYASNSPNITGFASSSVSGTNRLQDGPALLRQALGAGAAAPAPGAASQPAPATPIAGLPNLPAGLQGLPGLDQLASIAQLLPGLTPGSVLDISKLLPQIQALIPIAASGVNLPGLDKIFTIVGVAGAAGGAQAGTPASTGANLPINGQAAGAILGSGGNISTLAGLAGLAGFGSITTYVSAAQAVLGGVQGAIPAAKTQPSSATPAPAQLGSVPDLAALLGLAGSSSNIATLISSLGGSAQIVNGNFSGANKDALLSLLKVAYAQQYLDLISQAP